MFANALTDVNKHNLFVKCFQQLSFKEKAELNFFLNSIKILRNKVLYASNDARCAYYSIGITFTVHYFLHSFAFLNNNQNYFVYLWKFSSNHF